jgi:hypothetical protein
MRLSRRELALVAVALLLPVPLVAVSGYATALPDAVERGLGSLVTLEAEDERSGLVARGNVSEEADDEGRSASGTLTVARTGTPSQDGERTVTTDSADSDDGTESSDHDKGGPGDSPPGDDGDTGSSSPSGDGGGSSGTTSGSPPAPNTSPSVALAIGAQGTGAAVSAGGDGVTVDVGADTAGHAKEDTGEAEVVVTDADGSSTNVSIGVPDIQASIP